MHHPARPPSRLVQPLPRSRLLELYTAAVAVGLHGARDALLGGVDTAFVAGLSKLSDPASQLLADLTSLNGLELQDGSAPLLVWLRNAIALRNNHREAEVFRACADIVLPEEATSPANVPGAPLGASGDGGSMLLADSVFGALDAPFGESAIMRDVRYRASRIARSDLAMLIEGEPGTGRRTLATALARQRAQSNGGKVLVLDGIEGITDAFRSALRAAPAIPIDVLFHHVEALSEKQQAELARLIHSRQIRLIGVGRATQDADEAEPGELTIRSPELSAELKSTRVSLPPLRERGEDLSRWAHYLLKRAADRLDASSRSLGRDAVNGLLRQRWPGNLIELDAALNRALCMTSSPEITAADLGLADGEAAILPLKEAVEQFRRSYVDRALAHFSGNRTQAARALGVDARTVFRYLERRNK